MKKKLLMVIVTLALLMSACTSVKSSKYDGGKKIGILQFMSHPSLDDARVGFEDRIKELRIDAVIDYKNAQGDVATAKSIADKFVSDKVDLIYAIATPAAQAAQSATSDIPILFSAVTDAVDAQLVSSNDSPEGNISGTSDMVDIDKQLSLFKQIDNKIKTIGVIYSSDENNSVQQLKLVKEAAKKIDLEVKAVSIQNLSDIPQAVTSIEKEIDGLYMLSDNKVSSSSSLVTDSMKEKGIPVVATVEADVKQGALISLGINYKTLGSQTAEMAEKILNSSKKIEEAPVQKSKEIKKIVNTITLRDLGLDENSKIFKDAEKID